MPTDILIGKKHNAKKKKKKSLINFFRYFCGELDLAIVLAGVLLMALSLLFLVTLTAPTPQPPAAENAVLRDKIALEVIKTKREAMEVVLEDEREVRQIVAKAAAEEERKAKKEMAAEAKAAAGNASVPRVRKKSPSSVVKILILAYPRYLLPLQ